MKPSGAHWIWPDKKDQFYELLDQVVKVNPPKLINNRGSLQI